MERLLWQHRGLQCGLRLGYTTHIPTSQIPPANLLFPAQDAVLHHMLHVPPHIRILQHGVILVRLQGIRRILQTICQLSAYPIQTRKLNPHDHLCNKLLSRRFFAVKLPQQCEKFAFVARVWLEFRLLVHIDQQ